MECSRQLVQNNIFWQLVQLELDTPLDDLERLRKSLPKVQTVIRKCLNYCTIEVLCTELHGLLPPICSCLQLWIQSFYCSCQFACTYELPFPFFFYSLIKHCEHHHSEQWTTYFTKNTLLKTVYQKFISRHNSSLHIHVYGTIMMT